jgi:3-polyprenyl-4-hydroxybenzoate decarboxylase
MVQANGYNEGGKSARLARTYCHTRSCATCATGSSSRTRLIVIPGQVSVVAKFSGSMSDIGISLVEDDDALTLA